MNSISLDQQGENATGGGRSGDVGEIAAAEALGVRLAEALDEPAQTFEIVRQHKPPGALAQVFGRQRGGVDVDRLRHEGGIAAYRAEQMMMLRERGQEERHAGRLRIMRQHCLVHRPEEICRVGVHFVRRTSVP